MREKRILTIKKFISVVLLTIGLIVCIGWLVDNHQMRSLLPIDSPMKFNTAVCLILSASSLYFRKNLTISRIFSISLFFLSLCISLQYFLNIDLGIDELFFADKFSRTNHLNFPGRTSITTSVSYLLISIALFFLNSKSKKIILTIQVMLNFVTIISFSLLIIYLYNIPTAKKLSFFSSISLVSGLSLFLLSISITLVNSKTGIIRFFTKSNLGFYVNSRLFFVTTIIILLFGYFRLQSHKYNLISVELGISFFMIFFIIASFFTLWYTAIYINKIEKKRLTIEESYVKLNQELEEKIEKRTQQLKYSMERMELATNSGQIGIWELEVSNSRIKGNDIFYNILGVSNPKNNFDFDILFGNVLNEDQVKLKKLFQEITQGKNYEELYFRVRQKDHSIKYIKITKPYLSDKNLIFGAFIDITSQILNEVEIKSRYNSVKQFIEHAPTTLAMLDVNLNYIAVSKQWYSDYKIPFQNIIGVNHYDIFPEISERWKEQHIRCLNGQVIKVTDEMFIRENGHVQWIDFTISPWFEADKKIGGIVIHSTDITEQKNVENELLKIQERLQLATETSKVAIWDWDLLSNKIVVDDLMYSLHNLNDPKNNISSKSFVYQIHREDIKDTKRRLIYYLTNKQCEYIDLEYRVVINGKKEKFVWTKGKIKRGGNGIALRAIGTSIDITFQKEQYLNLKESEEKYFKMVNAVQDYAIILTDKHGKIKSWNIGANKIFNYQPYEAVGRFIDLILNDDDKIKNTHLKLLSEASENGKVHLESWLKRKDGSLFLANTSMTTLFSLNKEIIGFSILSQDLTERKKLELAEKIEIKNKELEQITYITSHDLQEPLRTISSFVNFLKDDYGGKLDKEADTYIKYILGATERMRLLIKELMDYARLGKMNDLKLIDANQIVNEVLDDLQIVINETGALISCDKLPTLNVYEIEFRLLLQNLIGNALKFRNKNKTAKIQIFTENKNNDWIFSVKDNGIGFDEKFKDKIFMMFQRLNNKNEFEGTGIGLAHCKKIVELHGGTIWVDSKEGEGSNFSFTIPKN